MINENKLKDIAGKVIDKMQLDNASKDKFGSVVAILMIISIILTLVRVIQECNNKKLVRLNKNDRAKFMQTEARSLCVKKTMFNQWRLKRIIKQNLSKEDYNNYGDQLQKAIMDVGIDLTDDEALTLVEASNV